MNKIVPNTQVSSEEEETSKAKTAPSNGRKERRMSQSLIMDESQIQRALKTFLASINLIKT